MEKQVYEITKTEGDTVDRSRKPIFIGLLISIVFILTFAIGAFVVIQLNYADRILNACEGKQGNPGSSTQDIVYNYDVDLGDADSLQDHTVLNTELRTEFVVMRSPDTGHIEYIVEIDYDKRMEIIYVSELQTCYFTPNLDFLPSFEEHAEFVRNIDGQLVSPRVVANYTVGERMMDPDIISFQIRPFCSTRNSYWLVPMAQDDETTGGRKKRAAWFARAAHCHCCCRMFKL